MWLFESYIHLVLSCCTVSILLSSLPKILSSTVFSGRYATFFLDLNITMLSPEDAVNNFGSKNPHLAYYSTWYHNFLSCLALKHGTITTFYWLSVAPIPSPCLWTEQSTLERSLNSELVNSDLSSVDWRLITRWVVQSNEGCLRAANSGPTLVTSTQRTRGSKVRIATTSLSIFSHL